MKLFIVLALVSVASAKLADSVVMAQYSAAKLQFGNQLPSSSADDKEHFLSFAAAANFVEDHNAEDGEEWTAEVNKFSLETEAEKALSLGLNVSTVLQEQRRSMMKRSSPSKLMVRALEADYSDKLPAIKNQGSCGSCWTFGAVASLEYQVNKARTGTMKSLSEQQYLDCVYEGNRDGCQGGWPAECYTWTKNNGNMIASTATMPYVGSDGTCNTDVQSAISGFAVTGTTYLTSGDTAMLAAVADAEIGVISVAIGVVNSFYSYSSGVYSGASCTSINHAVDVVGYGELNGVGYWRVRNSWGTWGDAGYINMKRGLNGANVNMCSIASYAHYPIVSGADDGSGDDSDDGSGDDSDDSDDSDDNSTCVWTKVDSSKLKGKLSGLIYSMSECQAKCVETQKCKGCSCKNAKKCMMNKKSNGKANKKFDSYTVAC